jgi:dihydroxyacetone kinase
MLDALLPAAEAFQQAVYSGLSANDALQAASAAAAAGARATIDMMPRRGRSSYLGARVLGHPDPGAEAVAVWLGALSHVSVGLGRGTPGQDRDSV